MNKKTNIIASVLAVVTVAALCCSLLVACGSGKEFVEVGFTENNIVMEVGETIDLAEMLVVTPASKKGKALWDIEGDDKGVVKIIDNKLTVLKYSDAILISADVEGFKGYLSIHVTDPEGGSVTEGEYTQWHIEYPERQGQDGQAVTLLNFDRYGLAINAGETEHARMRFNGNMRGNEDFTYSFTAEDNSLCEFTNFETRTYDFEQEPWEEITLDEVPEEMYDYYHRRDDQNFNVYFDFKGLKAGVTNATFTIGSKSIKFKVVVGEANYTQGLQFSEEWMEPSVTSGLNTNGYALKGLGSATGDEIIVPAAYQGLPVVSVGSQAFQNNTTIKNVTLPGTVEQIHQDAFNTCSALESIVLPEGLKAIDNNAFRECYKLASIKLPSSLFALVGEPFFGCVGIKDIETAALTFMSSDLKSIFALNQTEFHSTETLNYVEGRTLTVSDGVTEIPANAFNGCSQLTKITLPDGIVSIGNRAFLGCSGLTEITLPEGITEIDEVMFSGCSSLERVVLPDGIVSIGDSAFLGCAALTDINLPASLTTIARHAFNGCAKLENITLPAGLKTIGYEAFVNCTKLNNVALPSGIQTLADGVFTSCEAFTEMTVPSSILALPSGLFKGCKHLQTVHFADNLASIGESTFSGCEALQNFTIPNTVTSIGYGAFSNCTALTSMTIPSSVADLANSLFAGCTNLQTVNFEGVIRSIGTYTFNNCEKIESLVFSDGLISIDNYAFYNCKKLSTLKVGDSLQSIGDEAFHFCYALKELILPVTLTKIGNHAAFTVGSDGSAKQYINVYYKDNLSQWNSFAAETGVGHKVYSDDEEKQHIYFFSEGRPSSLTNNWGGYWHYDAQDQDRPVVWSN